MLSGKTHEVAAKCIEDNGHAAPSRTRQPCQHIHCDAQQDQRASLNSEHRITNKLKCWRCGDDRA